MPSSELSVHIHILSTYFQSLKVYVLYLSIFVPYLASRLEAGGHRLAPPAQNVADGRLHVRHEDVPGVAVKVDHPPAHPEKVLAVEDAGRLALFPLLFGKEHLDDAPAVQVLDHALPAPRVQGRREAGQDEEEEEGCTAGPDVPHHLCRVTDDKVLTTGK